MGVVPKPDTLYLEESRPSNIVWGYSLKAEEQSQAFIDDMLSALFQSSDAAFNHPELREDLELDTLVDQAFRPEFAPEFVRQVFASAPTNRAVVIDRQKTLETLYNEPGQRQELQDIAQSLNGIVQTLIDIDKQKRLKDYAYTGGLLAAEVTLLSGYVDAIHRLTNLTQSSEALAKLADFGRDIQATGNFRELETYSDAFRNRHTLSLEVAVDAIGAVTGLNIVDIDKSGRFTRRGFLPNIGGRLLLGRLKVDEYKIVAQAIDKIIDKNIKQISEATFLLGELDFYLSCLRFYDAMETKGVSMSLPAITDDAERKTHISNVRNPLLLYKKGEKNIERGKDIIPNDISYDPTHRVRLVSGPNSGGKTVYLKSIGIVQTAGQNGMRVPAQANDSECYLSVADGVYTVFIAREETTDEAGGQLEYQAKQVLQVLGKLTQNSVILLDEIGRGTSEDEGTEFCLDNILYPIAMSAEGPIESVTYFSTHLHGLTRRAEDIQGVENYQAQIAPIVGGQLAPTYKIIPGRADKSHAKLVEGRVGLGRENVDRLISERRGRGAL